MSFEAVIAVGDRRASLEAVRDVVAATLIAADPANVAGLAKQLQAVLKELAELPADMVGDPVGEILNKLADGRPPAVVVGKAVKRKVAGVGKRMSKPAG